MQTKLVRDLSSVHGVRQVLLVGKDKQDGLTKLILIQHAVELIAGLANAITIVRVNNKYHALGVLVVVAPERADLVLTSCSRTATPVR